MQAVPSQRARALSGALFLLAQVTGAAAASGSGALRVGTSADYAPFSFRDAAGEVTGFDVAVARRLGSDLGRQVEFVPLRWADLASQLVSGAFDVAMSGVTVRADRALQVAFSRPYARTGAVAVMRGVDTPRYRALADLDVPGVRVGVNAGGHLEQVARQRFPHAHVIAVADNRTLPDLLQRGEVDAVISEAFEAHTWAGPPLRSLGPFTHDHKAYAVAPTANELLQQIDDWLAAREADGWLNEQRRRWLGEGAMVTPAQAGCAALAGVIDLRLQLMPLVAAAKRRDRLPIDDPAQEARVLEHVRAAALTRGLVPDDVAGVFRVQIAVAKAVERSAPPGPLPAELTLAQLRSAVGRASDQIIAELARGQAWLHAPGTGHELETALQDGLTIAGVTSNQRTEIRQSLLQVRRRP